MTSQQVLLRYAAGERDFRRVDLRGQRFENVDLCGVDFSGADIRQTKFVGTNLADAKFCSAKAGRYGIEAVLWFLVFWALHVFIYFNALIWLPTLAWTLSDEMIGKDGNVSFLMYTLCVGSCIFYIRSGVVVIWLNIMMIMIGAFSMALSGMGLLQILEQIASYKNLSNLDVNLAVVGAIAVAIGKSAPKQMTVQFIIGTLIVQYFSIIRYGIFSAVCCLIACGLAVYSVILIHRRISDGDERYTWKPLSVLYVVRGTQFKFANLKNADFSHALLASTDFRGSILERTDFQNVQFVESSYFGTDRMSKRIIQHLSIHRVGITQRYDGLDLSSLCLRKVVVEGASFIGADLSNTDLSLANLRGALLSSADLRGANLRRTALNDTVLKGARVDVATYVQSDWDAELLVDFRRRGVEILGLEKFPDNVQSRILGTKEGLILSFNTRLTAIDRFFIDGVIFGVLGKESDCQVVEFKQGLDSATLRLQSSSATDLETVAEALYRRIWERQQCSIDHLKSGIMLKTEPRSLMPFPSILGGAALAQLTNLREHLSTMELNTNEQQNWSWNLVQDRLHLIQPLHLFVSYAQADEQHRFQLEGHLTMLRRQGVIESWHSGMIEPGMERDVVVNRRLDEADIVLLLLSSDYLRSDALHEQMQRAVTERKRVIPIAVRPVDLCGTPIQDMRILPDEGIAVSNWNGIDEVWLFIANQIRRIAMEMIRERVDRRAVNT